MNVEKEDRREKEATGGRKAKEKAADCQKYSGTDKRVKRGGSL